MKELIKFIKIERALEYDIFTKLEKLGLDIDTIVDLYKEIDDFRDKTFKIGEHLDKDKYINRDTYITEDYEGASKHLKLHVIYEYGDGMALCQTTSEDLHLVPINLLAEESNL